MTFDFGPVITLAIMIYALFGILLILLPPLALLAVMKWIRRMRRKDPRFEKRIRKGSPCIVLQPRPFSS